MSIGRTNTGRLIAEKGAKARTRASLFIDPCLMAADILLYDTDRYRSGMTKANMSSSAVI